MSPHSAYRPRSRSSRRRASRGAAALRRPRRVRQRCPGRGRPRRPGRDRQHRDQFHTRNHHRHAGRLLVHQHSGRPLCRQGVLTGIPRSGAIRRAGQGWPDQPRRSDASGWRDERDHHGPVGCRAAANGQGGRPHGAQVHRDHEFAAQSLPELSGARRPGAGLAAAGLPECRNRHAAAVAQHDGERPGWRGQHHAHRRHPERQRRPAAPQRLHCTGRDDRVGQHHDEQHGC